ncbi:MAG: MFS transporter [Bacteroidales bacterium]|nr:MFS transporter [Bacteroidales bacterium]
MGESHIDSSRAWKWKVCGLLLLATMIMYMDRQTLAVVAVRVTQSLDLSNEQYGNLELAFGLAFAFGSLLFGTLADRANVRWVYPLALIGWSTSGILTGFSRSYEELLVCRTMLGFFESGNWPCALVITQRLLARSDRSLGNSILQSGASIGAVLTPVAVLGIFSIADPGEDGRLAQWGLSGGMGVAVTGEPPMIWPLPFLVVGFIGLLWVSLWFLMIPAGSLARPQGSAESQTSSSYGSLFRDRRFYILIVMVICISIPWQLIRAWLPKVLMESRGYSETVALGFNSAYYIAADAGCLLAGWITYRLARGRLGVHGSRVLVFGVAAGLTSLTVLAAVLPAGIPLMAILIIIAAGSLAMYPCYYSFTQELTTTGMGKLSGTLAFSGWVVSAITQPEFGRLADETGSHDIGFALAGIPALIPVVLLLLFWRKT